MWDRPLGSRGRRAFLTGTASFLTLGASATSLMGPVEASPSRRNPVGASRDPLVSVGDIVDTLYDPAPAVGRYLGNGRFGAVFGKLGLHVSPSDREANEPFGKTQFMHMRHWGRFRFHSPSMESDTSADYLIPVARMYWETPPQNISRYTQRQAFSEGALYTAFSCEGAERVSVTNWFDAEDRDLAGVMLEVDGTSPAIVIDATEAFIPYNYGQNQLTRQSVRVTEDRGQWRLDIGCDETDPAVRSRLFVKTDAEVTIVPQGLRIAPRAGASAILLSFGKPVVDAPSDSLERTRDWWRSTWAKSAAFAFSDDSMQAIWVRSMAYILSTFNDDGLGFAPTNGLSGNLFPFNFAQDLLYVHGALASTGQVGVLRSWIERFHAMIPEMQAYARRLWPDVEGIYPPWELPFGPVEGYHEPSVPIIYCYEPHNAGYLSRMAHETAILVDDPLWTERIARPLISEVARYYRSFSRKGADGLWHLALTPAVGQDEAGGRNQADYLCVLYSAQYSFSRAVDHGLDDDGAYAGMLRDGLAFPSLLAEQGFYYTSAGAGPKDFGSQKHPVQLNALAYLPVASAPTPPDRIAYDLRHDITEDARKPYFHGWTLGEMLLAGTRIGDSDGWAADWAKLGPSRYTDPRAVQFFETSHTPFKAFYVTTHGLVASSLVENVVTDYWGEVEVGRCNPAANIVAFRNVRTLAGLVISGEVRGRTGSVVVEAWKDCDTTLHGLRLALRKGERRPLTLGVEANGRPSASLGAAG